MMTFAGIGTLFFPSTTAEGTDYFPNIWEGVWQLLSMTTTGNFPDIMLTVMTVEGVRLRLMPHTGTCTLLPFDLNPPLNLLFITRYYFGPTCAGNVWS